MLFVCLFVWGGGSISSLEGKSSQKEPEEFAEDPLQDSFSLPEQGA